MSENSSEISKITTVDNFDEAESSLLDFFQVIADNLRLLVFGPIACGVVAFAISSAIPPIFTAKTQFLPPQQQQSTAASMLASLSMLGSMVGNSASIKNPADQYISFMKSITFQDALIERFSLAKRYGENLKTDTRLVLKQSVRITSSKDGLISVEVDDKDPKIAAELANAHVDELHKLLGKLAVTDAQQRRLFYELQLEKTKQKLSKADYELKATGISSSTLKLSPGSAVESVIRLKAAISVQEVKVNSMSSYLTENSPELRQAVNELRSLKIQLAKLEKDEPIKLDENNYISRYREYKYQESMFELLVKQFELARLDESREIALIQVLDVAEPPERKSKPMRGMIALVTTLLTCMTLIVILSIRESFRKTYKYEKTQLKFDEIRKTITKKIKFYRKN
jgi:tyrosine-protein kinase Etk/Wzc